MRSARGLAAARWFANRQPKQKHTAPSSASLFIKTGVAVKGALHHHCHLLLHSQVVLQHS
jgi:hypothetical protein